MTAAKGSTLCVLVNPVNATIHRALLYMTNSSVLLCSNSQTNLSIDGWVSLHCLCFSVPCRSNANWDWPVEGVELHGQHRVRLQSRVWVIGRRPRLLSHVPTIKWSCYKALQDLLHFMTYTKKNVKIRWLQHSCCWGYEAFKGLTNSWLFFNFLKRDHEINNFVFNVGFAKHIFQLWTMNVNGWEKCASF